MFQKEYWERAKSIGTRHSEPPIIAAYVLPFMRMFNFKQPLGMINF